MNLAGIAGDRVVSGVAAGTVSASSSDAVNGSQLAATNDAVAGLAAGAGQQAIDIDALKGSVNQAFKEIDKLRGGVAIALASTGFALEPGKTFGVGVNMGFYGDVQAIGIQAGARLDKTWTIQGGVGWASNGGPVGGRVGLAAQW